jgi:hypothetical protein
MPALADIQSAIRDALVRGDRSVLAPILSGGADPAHRLAIHQRHYAASLTRALLDRFPATVWLVGSELVTDGWRSKASADRSTSIAWHRTTFFDVPMVSQLETADESAAHRQRRRIEGHRVG